MPWGRIDDSFYDHPKVIELGRYRLPCVGLYLLALSWSNRYLTDGFVPFERVKKFGGTPKLAEMLVRVGLWDLVVEGYRIHDFLDYNYSAKEVRQRADLLRALGKRGGCASGEARRLKRAGSQNGSDTVEAKTNPVPVPSLNPPTPLVDKSKKKNDA